MLARHHDGGSSSNVNANSKRHDLDLSLCLRLQCLRLARSRVQAAFLGPAELQNCNKTSSCTNFHFWVAARCLLQRHPVRHRDASGSALETRVRAECRSVAEQIRNANSRSRREKETEAIRQRELLNATTRTRTKTRTTARTKTGKRRRTAGGAWERDETRVRGPARW